MVIKSSRRYYLDQLLSKTEFRGRVLDVGGKKVNKRGSFTPPLDKVQCWHYLNVDSTTMPDFLCTATRINVSQEYDFVLMSEVLEYISDYKLALSEAFRVIKINGQLIISIPFLFPIHRDIGDRIRFTEFEISELLKNIGFKSINVLPMGSVFSVIYDILLVAYGYGSGEEDRFINKIIRNRVLPIFFKIITFLDKKNIYCSKYITTGYFITASK